MKVNIDQIKIESNKLKLDHTICLIADIHNTKYSSKNKWITLIEEITKINPEFILIAGDVIYNADDLFNENVENLNYFLKVLSSIAPVFVSYGNHDLKNGINHSKIDALNWFSDFEKNNSNFHILNNTSYEFNDIRIFGIVPVYESYYFKYQSKWASYFIEALLDNKVEVSDSLKFNIMLIHSPLVLDELEKYINNNKLSSLKKVRTLLESIDLFTCGHMHDGLIPKHWQKMGIIKNDIGIMASEGKSIKDLTLRKVKLCRGIHQMFNGKLVITGGITKWCQPNPIFNTIDKACAKDVTVLKLIKK